MHQAERPEKGKLLGPRRCRASSQVRSSVDHISYSSCESMRFRGKPSFLSCSVVVHRCIKPSKGVLAFSVPSPTQRLPCCVRFLCTMPLVPRPAHHINCAMVRRSRILLLACRYLGLMENLRVARAGYCYRRPFAEFLERCAFFSSFWCINLFCSAIHFGLGWVLELPQFSFARVEGAFGSPNI